MKASTCESGKGRIEALDEVERLHANVVISEYKTVEVARVWSLGKGQRAIIYTCRSSKLNCCLPLRRDVLPQRFQG